MQVVKMQVMTLQVMKLPVTDNASDENPVCVLGHFFRISLAQLLLLRQAAFFPPAQLIENLRKK